MLRIIQKFSLLLAFAAAITHGARADEVNLYTDRQSALLEPMLDAFTQDSGIAVNVLFAKKGLMERMQSEGAQSPADVVLIVDAARLEAFAQAGLLAPYDATDDANAITQGLSKDLYTPYWFAVTRRARVLFVDKDNTSITDYDDLSDAAKTGKGVCMRSGFHPYNIAFVAERIARDGEAAAEQWLRGVKNNLARTPQGNDRAQIQGVLDGVCSVAVANSYYYFLMIDDPRKRDDVLANIKVVIPKPAHINITGAGLAKHAPHKDNAQQLLEFLASKKAQAMFAEKNREYPARNVVPLDDSLKSLAITGQLAPLFDYRALASALMEKVEFDIE